MTATKTISKTPKKKVVQKRKLTKVSLEERHHMIAEAAYYKAKERNFSTGDPNSDWLKAEMEIDSQINKRKQQGASASL